MHQQSPRARVTHRREAPVRRRQAAPRVQPPMIADVVITFAFACWSMALVVVVSGYAGDAFGEAGRRIAFMFAGSLVLAGGFLWLLGATFLREARWSTESWIVPSFIGAVIGAIGVVVLINLWVYWLWAPPLLVVFALRPVRRALLRPFYQPDTGSAR